MNENTAHSKLKTEQLALPNKPVIYAEAVAFLENAFDQMPPFERLMWMYDPQKLQLEFNSGALEKQFGLNFRNMMPAPLLKQLQEGMWRQ